jgi:hypothetical protein
VSALWINVHYGTCSCQQNTFLVAFSEVVNCCSCTAWHNEAVHVLVQQAQCDFFAVMNAIAAKINSSHQCHNIGRLKPLW